MLPVITLAVFLLMTVGSYLLMHRSLLRVALGLGCLGHGINLIVLSAGRWGQRAPLVAADMQATDVTDPVPQAFVLTAIVITMALTLYLLAVAVAQTRRGGRAELVAAPESDTNLDAESLAAEFAGRPQERA
jgi:multicomponent Na+:H+ antiporter subunit C